MSESDYRLAFWEGSDMPAPGKSLSTEEYLALPESSVRMEFVGGSVVYPFWSEETMSPAPSPIHQDAVLLIATLLVAMAKRVGGSTHMAPIDVVLPSGDVIQPDVMWRAEDSRCIRTEDNFRGTPELVVEVLSSQTAARDRSKKYEMYEKAQVREYWLVDPRDQLVEVFSLVERRFQRIGAFAPGDAFQSPVFARKIPANVLFEPA
jgi:Uma2 family endonuclease